MPRRPNYKDLLKKIKIDKFRNECNLHLDSNKKIVLEIKKII
jgi:hypothetical protein